MWTGRQKSALLAAVIVVLAAACGGQPVARPSPSVSPTSSASAVPTPSALPSEQPGDTPPSADRYSCEGQTGGPGSGGAQPGNPSNLRDARVGTHADYDRFVLEFDSAAWRYEVFPQDNRFFPAISPESPITLQGSAGLRVVIHNATNHDEHGVPFEKTFNTEPGFPALRQAVLWEDVGGTIVWALGVARASCFATDVLQNPSRFVLDIQH